MINNTNDHSKRTSATVKSILNKGGIFNVRIENMGDNRHFTVAAIEPTDIIKIRYTLKKLGFIQVSKNGSITEIACF
jgi:hypothetical protein